MCQQIGWTRELGQNFQADQKGLMDAVQRKRAANGQPQTSPQMLHALGCNGLCHHAPSLSQVEMYKVPYLLSRQYRLRCIGNSRREIVWHAFVDIQLDYKTGSIEGLVYNRMKPLKRISFVPP